MPRVLLIDHFDSFTQNVRHGFLVAGAEVETLRADGVDVEALDLTRPDLLVLGPGPGRPMDSPCAGKILARLAGRVPILGICLGHQAIAAFYGGTVHRAPEPVHGKADRIRHDGRGLFRGLPDPLEVGRYHSLVVDALPLCLEATARTEDGLLMALRHRELPVAGLQFHPDSFLSPEGPELFRHALLADF